MPGKKRSSLWIIVVTVLLFFAAKRWPDLAPMFDAVTRESHSPSSTRTAQHHDPRPEPNPGVTRTPSAPSSPASMPVSGDVMSAAELPASNVHDFDTAKRELRRLFSRGREFYCNCSYDFARRPEVDPTSCGLASTSKRAQRIEWEHVVPASFYGKQFTAWRNGDPDCTGRASRGRECARRASPVFRQIEGDMYNLMPAVGELNRARADDEYGNVPGEPREFGKCDFETFAKITEPRPEIRGDIARIYFYMDARYPKFHFINASNQQMMEEWAAADPMDDAELTRIKKIEAVQGNSFFIGRVTASAQGRGSSAQSAR